MSFRPLADHEGRFHVELTVHALFLGRKQAVASAIGITSGRSTSYVCPLVTMAAEPLLRTFFSQSVRFP